MPDHRAKFALRMQYRGRERIIELPLSQDLLGRLAIEAHFHNLSVGEITVKLITGPSRLIPSRCSHEAPHCCACHVYGDRADHLDHPDHLGLVVDRGHDSVMRDLRTCL